MDRLDTVVSVAAWCGLSLELARILLCRLAYLDAYVTLAGVDLRVQGPPSLRVVRELYRAGIGCGEEIRVVPTGPEREIAVAEIKHVFDIEDPEPHGACLYANRGPRGLPSTLPGVGPYTYGPPDGGLDNLFGLSKAVRP